MLDISFGSLWTNIPYDLIKKRIFNAVINLLLLLLIKTKFIIMIQYLLSDLLPMHQSIIYINSLVNVGIALNQASFADTYNIGTGNDWKIDLIKE